MRISIIRTIAFILFSIGLTTALAEELGRGEVIRIDDNNVEIFYTGSYALLIGESDYTHSWQDLNAIPGELQLVEDLLKSQDFQVETVLNLNASQLRNTINHFINQYGFQKENRLLFFYSGHGHTHNDKGYLVPIDVPHPNVDEKVFCKKL
ncbi:conserved hypothetical protein [Beggiatoa sp. PS]|nr:conserved hypothetical protein [Beggiatoa sp. PS]